MRAWIVSSVIGLGVLGLIGLAPDASATSATQNQRDSGDYVGPATPNAHSGNVFQH